MTQEESEKILIEAVEDKKRRLVRTMVHWSPAGRGDRIERAVKEAVKQTLESYLDLLTNDPDSDEDSNNEEEYINEVIEYVLNGIDEAISRVEEQLNHTVTSDQPNAFDYMCAEIRHQVMSRLIRELAHDLEHAASESQLHK